ncbi:hypothetical protein BJ085DRAFT_39504 [Dimargaris cristalligena]|uniref:Uncharacterized protein n=1 Tax=Dimargaris cristalligena TaxID=215637 RepID=A0A4Q0A2A9_9FUNG|nr:hypothetical protein BJ085DRAFT_39504 [Dimargaris cristalligena]|eukprot:RKP40243.1 hypothetical protein BJ085DRAFT_39504 [Dimargaris cristalligena]
MKFSVVAFAAIAVVCTFVQGAILPTTQKWDRRQMSGVGAENIYNVKVKKILATDSAMNSRIITDLNTLKLGSKKGSALYSVTKPYSSISSILSIKIAYGVESQVKKFSWYNTMYIDSVGSASGGGSDDGCLGFC